ncbi:phage terminase small subunit [Bacillus altitudinis]|uniref:phage terminase small subunit n=1 Tax=Bacillus altitudinis TaxID=293387 RepID=UPI00227D9B50|nr:phage terminase small subunit [Bacillus altitudinis]MCY7498230.1 phage terminase small subunit [Bacillus altitudinis]MCY7535447.1 phage terminase small subunit [Bacillus altitudinis]MCY7545464.1 phage terminase small subunit [Bacillus altitudinis]MCY7553564.1 phage terminase small subunit [Bacillus altitudinis]MCY7592200.1 phage terminase small subunit [Bacillus altitudinis]
MARPRDPRRDEAFRLWKESDGARLLKDIADELGVTSSTVRKWKANDKWEDKFKGSAPKLNRSAPLRSGAPKGNKNAKGNKGGKAPTGNQNAKGNRGGAAPKGNKNSLRTGEYESIMFDYMDDTEKELFEQIETDPLYQIELTIRELSIRERRMMHRIMKYENGLTDNQRRVLQQLRKTKDVAPSTSENGVVKYVPIINERLLVTEVEEIQLPVIDRILEIEEALTRVTDKRLKAIRQKHDIMKTMSEHELRLRGLDLANRMREAELERITARPVDDSVQITIKRKNKGDG